MRDKCIKFLFFVISMCIIEEKSLNIIENQFNIRWKIGGEINAYEKMMNGILINTYAARAVHD